MSKALQLETRSISVGTSSGELLAPSSRRDILHIQNNSAQVIYILFGTVTVTAANGIKFISADEKTFEIPGFGAIQAFTSGGGAVNLTVTTNIEGFG